MLLILKGPKIKVLSNQVRRWCRLWHWYPENAQSANRANLLWYLMRMWKRIKEMSRNTTWRCWEIRTNGRWKLLNTLCYPSAWRRCQFTLFLFWHNETLPFVKKDERRWKHEMSLWHLSRRLVLASPESTSIYIKAQVLSSLQNRSPYKSSNQPEKIACDRPW